MTNYPVVYRKNTFSSLMVIDHSAPAPVEIKAIGHAHLPCEWKQRQESLFKCASSFCVLLSKTIVQRTHYGFTVLLKWQMSNERFLAPHLMRSMIRSIQSSLQLIRVLLCISGSWRPYCKSHKYDFDRKS
ncbi:hypothetical protein CEXT_26301 [Caerostris extrusa]|uniref:Uncharacterized protein n=1 Tax=Caerostris extrusa TaxID=172846 RepID=A0AAV4QPF2_CAEEX|nr:hypothetical protein CEXT_26301 [Caerostris extrusa]